MSVYEDKLSAFLDGELPESEAREIEDALARDPGLQAELEALMEADVVAKSEFDTLVDDPVPLELAAAIRNAPEARPANDPAPPTRARWAPTAVAALCLAIGGSGGYYAGLMGGETPPPRGWLADIADYHAVYADQKRHLVEVPAAEADHIRTWLTASIGAEVPIPDLEGNGLTFQGARLLVAVGKPVAQLMYTDADGGVVALCLIRSDTPQDGFAARSIGGFDMVTWGGSDANFVIVGTEGRSDLGAIAEAASLQV